MNIQANDSGKFNGFRFAESVLFLGSGLLLGTAPLFVWVLALMLLFPAFVLAIIDLRPK